MVIREITISDIDNLQELYLHLHETEKLTESEELHTLCNEIIKDENYFVLVGEIERKIVASVTLVIIKNLTRGMKPYALIENVVTDKSYRNRGYAKALMQSAIEIAKNRGCYKIMLLTGAKSESVLSFYEKCGFNSKDKIAFIKWI